MLHSRYLWGVILFFYSCCVGATPLALEGNAFNDAPVLQAVFDNIQSKPHFFKRNYVIELMSQIEISFNEMLKHEFCEQVWKQLAITIHSSNIKASSIVGDLAAHFGLFGTDIIRARLMLAMMMSFNDLELMTILGTLPIENCQEYVDAAINDLDSFSTELKKRFKDAVVLDEQRGQKAWGKKKYLLLALLLLGITITISAGYKMYKKTAEVNKHHQEIKQLEEAIADMKMAIGQGKDAQKIEQLMKGLAAVKQTLEQGKETQRIDALMTGLADVKQTFEQGKETQRIDALMEDLAGVKASIGKGKDFQQMQARIEELTELVVGMDHVLRSNAEATLEFVEVVKARTEGLERTVEAQRNIMQKQIEEMQEYADQLHEVSEGVTEKTAWYENFPSFIPKSPAKLFTTAAATITAAGAAKEFAQSLGAFGNPAGEMAAAPNWIGYARAAKHLKRFDEVFA